MLTVQFKQILCVQEEEQGNMPDDAKGIEMGEDFEGALQDMPKPDEDQLSDSQEGEGDRLEQQMGDVGPEGETVDERLWGPQDEREGQGPEEQQPEGAALQVGRPIAL